MLINQYSPSRPGLNPVFQTVEKLLGLLYPNGPMKERRLDAEIIQYECEYFGAKFGCGNISAISHQL
jgi:hypothetical protein